MGDIIINVSPQTGYLLVSQADGTYAVEVTDVPTIHRHKTFADMNGDGLADLLTSNLIFPRLSGENRFDLDGKVILPESDGVNFIGVNNFAPDRQHDLARMNDNWRTDSRFDYKRRFYYNFNGAAADMNGDGLQDYVQRENGQWIVHVNTGDGSFRRYDTGASAGTHENQVSFPVDYNQDGYTDIIAQNPAGTAWRVLLTRIGSNGNLIFEALRDHNGNEVKAFNNLLKGALNYELVTDWLTQTPVPQFVDLNHDGIIDVRYYNDVLYGKINRPDLLQTVTQGLGDVEMTFTYSPLVETTLSGARAPVYQYDDSADIKDDTTQNHAMAGMQVVAKYQVSNGIGGTNDTYYYYQGVKTDVTGRGSLGFEQVTIDNTVTSLLNTTEYHQHFPLVGRVKQHVVKHYDDKLVSIDNTFTGYTLDSHGVFDVVQDGSVTRSYNLTTTDASQPLSVSKTTQSVTSDYGCADTVTVQTGESVSASGTALADWTVNNIAKTSSVSNQYDNDANDWLLCFAHTSTQTQTVGDDTQSTTTTAVQLAGTLFAESTTRFAGIANLESTTTYGRATNGTLTSTTVTGNNRNGIALADRTVTHILDDNDFLITQTCNALNHCVDYLDYYQRFGLPETVEDANGLQSVTRYDIFGRAVETTSPDGSLTLVKYYACDDNPPVGVNCPTGAVLAQTTEVTHETALNTLGAPRTIVYTDMLGREIRSESLSMDGTTTVKLDTLYNARGLVEQVSNPYTGSSAEYWNTSEYDALGRVTLLQRAGGGQLRSEYLAANDSAYVTQINEIETLVIPDYLPEPEGGLVRTRSQYFNVLGQVARVENAKNIPVDYVYDAQGQLVQTEVNDEASTTVTIRYDAAGNRTSIRDPDAGTVDFNVNSFGEVEVQTWAKDTADAKSITTEYDAIGRPTTRTDAKGSTTTLVSSWGYDTQKIGLLDWKRSDNGFEERYTYDGLSRLETSTTDISGLAEQSFTNTYDAYSRIQSVAYPNGLTIQNHYHATGFPYAVEDISDANNKKVLQLLNDTVDSQGNFIQSLYGNGLQTVSQYHAQTGQLASIQTGYTAGEFTDSYVADIQNLAYQWDSIGNLYQRTSFATTLESDTVYEDFQYDAINRLKEATSYRNGTEFRTHTYGYDNLGNLTSKTGVGTLEYNQTTGSSGNARQAGVHAITRAKGIDYEYDAYGNMIKRGTDTFEYDVFNKPTQLGDTQFDYGPDRVRFKQINGEDQITTYYIGGGVIEIVDEGDGTINEKIYVGGFLVYTKTGSETSTTYLHKDHIGSTEAMTDEWGIAIDRMSFDAFGKRQESDWSDGDPTAGMANIFPTSKGFTGHEMLDQLGLIHMNGRVYDPEIGRFLTPDLFIQAPLNSQSYNRYTYVFNNPLSHVDPTGYLAEQGYGDDVDKEIDEGDKSNVEQQGASDSDASAAGDTVTTQDGTTYRDNGDGTYTETKTDENGKTTETTSKKGHTTRRMRSNARRSSGRGGSAYASQSQGAGSGADVSGNTSSGSQSNQQYLQTAENHPYSKRAHKEGSSFKDKVLKYFRDKVTVTASGTLGIGAGGKGQVIVDPSDLSNSKVYGGGGGVLGASVTATADFTVGGEGYFTDDQLISKTSLTIGAGLAVSGTIIASETGTQYVISAGFGLGVSGSGVIGKQGTQGSAKKGPLPLERRRAARLQ